MAGFKSHPPHVYSESAHLSVEDFYRYLIQRYALSTAQTTVHRLQRLLKWMGTDLSGLLEQEMVVDYILSKPATSAGYRYNLLLVYTRFLKYAGERPIQKTLEALVALDRLRERRLPRVPSYTTCLAGLAALRGHTRTVYALALFAGLRLSEALSLKWTQVDLNSRQIIIEKSEKRSEGSIIPIPDQLYDILQEARKAANDLVSGGVKSRSVQKTIMQLRKRLKTEDAAFLTIKNLRHVFASRIYATTKDIVYTQRMLRHRSLLTTQKYVHMITSPRTFDVVALDPSDHQKISELLSNGFEVALQTRGKVYLRRPRGL